MAFYHLEPAAMRHLQRPDDGEILAPNGADAAAVLRRLQDAAPAVKGLVQDYVGAVVPGVEAVARVEIGPREGLEFRQVVDGETAYTFAAQSMSEGILRALGVLLAIFQRRGGDVKPTLIGVEEPEAALHPAAAGALLEAFVEASKDRQVVATSHSTDLLDDPGLPPDAIRAVRRVGGSTEIGPLDDAARSALLDGLFTGGELLRVDQLVPDERRARFAPGQLHLFDEVPGRSHSPPSSRGTASAARSRSCCAGSTPSRCTT